MFLIDRPAVSLGLRADLAPRQLFGSAGDLVRTALVTRPPVTGPTAPLARRPLETEHPLPARTRRRKAG
jgi:hypothetical protein